MIGAIVTGTLVGDPVERTTREGKPFVTATARVTAGEDAIFVGLAAFEPTAAARLLQMRKGGTVAACGVLEQTTWTTQAGETRTGWRLTASEVLTAYGATKKRRTADGGEE
ncbi:MAG: single-stranded DNA-binding protein [Burkholderiaceae bacterium]|nr:single-stranded DNA-binding protein [Burkholderiaceae bacterium]